MRATFSHPAVQFLWIHIVSGWLHPKCYIYDSGQDLFKWSCFGSIKYTAYCPNVTTIEEDLRGLPSNINSLCINIHGTNTPMSLGFFSQFHDLEYLNILGCFSKILEPGNILPNLQTLSLYSPRCCDCHIGPQIFRDVVKLRDLFITNYKLAAMAPDVFHSIPDLQFISLVNYLTDTPTCVEDFSEILCRIMDITTLKELNVEALEIQSIKHSNCSILNPSLNVTNFNNSKSSSLSFLNLIHIEDGALACLQNLTRFSMFFNHEVLLHLHLSGIKHIEYLQLRSFKEIDIKMICKLVFIFSIKNIDVGIIDFGSHSMSDFNMCVGLEYMSFEEPEPHSPALYLKWDFIYSLNNLDALKIQVKEQNIHDICSFHKQPITWLTNLSLFGRRLQILFAKQFSCLENLLYLYLSYNVISNIQDFAFQGLTKLEYLEMKENKITQIHENTFIGLNTLKVLDLRENPLIPSIEAMSFAHLTCLRQVFLGDLNYPPTEPVIKLNLTPIFGDVLSQLTDLFISSGLRPMQLVIGSNITLNHNLSLQLKGKTVSFEDCDRPFFKSVMCLKADAEEFLCRSEFMGKYFRSVETFEYKSRLSAKSVDLTSINQLINLKKLILLNVDLSRQREADTIFHNLTKLDVLKLENCRINCLERSLTKDLQSLTVLSLHIENIYNVFYSFTEPLSSLKYLKLDRLQMFCSCDNNWLIAWAKQYRQVEVMMDPPLDDLTCLSDNGIDRPNFVKYAEDNCTTHLGFLLFVSTTLGVLLFLLVVLLHNLAGPYLLPLYHITLGWIWAALRSNTRGRYNYDVFVSYSGKDERWVVEELLPNMEQRGPPFLSLCLHSRDFQLGKDIVENITDSLYQSRHTLCLVSRHYLRSNWCSLEMRLATTRLQVEQRDILLLVFLEKIPSRLLSAHHRLARLVKTRTYLDWPQDPLQHQAFWDKLWTNLKCKPEE